MNDQLREWFQRLKSIFRRKQLDQDLDVEIATHLDLAIAENLRSGMSPAQARRQALLNFGGAEQAREKHREARGIPALEALIQNFAFGFRMMRKNWGVTALAGLTLALGIGANTAIFSVVYGALLSPLPYPHPDELVMLWSTINQHNDAVSVADYLDWKRQNTAFQDMVAWTGGRVSLSISGHPEAMQTRVISPGFFNMQGIPLLLGRDFLPEEGTVGNDHGVIMTNRMWQERFGGDPHVLGQQLRLNGDSYTVVGVLSPGMPDRFESQIFLPLAFRPEQLNHDTHSLMVMGRMKPGTTPQQANADMDGVARRNAQVYPASNSGWGVKVEPLQNAFTTRDTVRNLWLLMGAVGFVLLIACVNVANLLLARGTVRQKEVAVRAALGATRWQIFSQFLAESLALAFIGGALGVGVAWASLKVVLTLLPQYSIPTEAEVRLNLPVLLFSFAATLLAGVLCGCAPAWQGTHWDPADALKEGGRSGGATGRKGLRRILVVVEFALALTLLAGAGLVIHSFWKLMRVDLGFRQDHLLTFTLPVRNDRFSHSEQINAFYRQLLEKIKALPGVVSASVSTGLPVVGTNIGMPFSIVGQPVSNPSSRPGAGFTMVTPDFFQTLGIRIAKGRGFTEQDGATGAPVAVVNDTFVDKYLFNSDPLAQRLVVDEPIPGPSRIGPAIERQIVGVYHNVHNNGVRQENFPEINVPFWQSPWPNATISVRTTGDPASMTNSITAVVQSIDTNLPLDQVRTMDQIVDESLAGERFAAILFATFASIALILAAIGIYGVMSFAVAQQTHEIGLRMALGARPGQVLLLVLQEGMLLALMGLILGLGGAYFVERALSSALYEVVAADSAVVAAVSILLFLFAVLACYLPARRATRVNPIDSLRYE